MTPDVRSLDEAVEDLRCFSKQAIRNAAAEHGFLIKMGRGYGIDRNDYGRLLKKCRDQARVPDSTSTTTARNGTSSTPDADPAQRAAQAAKMLKKPSQRTSQQEAAQVLPMSRKT